MSFLEIRRGNSPLVLGMPHTGTEVPPDIAASLNDTGHMLADTDWHIHNLYTGLVGNLTSIRTTVHRFVIDVNRDPRGVSLYPGQNTTSLCPLTDFDGRAIWRNGHEPDATEIRRRTSIYHAPYHEALSAELARVRAIHGFAIFYDCHSIRSQIPFLFKGVLPDFNIGTNQGRTCAATIEAKVHGICTHAREYSVVLNGRFKGGWTTRHYGHPDEGLHAIQMELAQSAYMCERPPWVYESHRAGPLRGHLGKILDELIRWRPE